MPITLQVIKVTEFLAKRNLFKIKGTFLLYSRKFRIPKEEKNVKTKELCFHFYILK